MKDESEVILHHGERDDDNSNKARRQGDGRHWLVESYCARTTKAMLAAGAQQLQSRIDGHLFQVDARQLILFIATTDGLVVEFRKHKKRQYSEEAKAKLVERLRGIRPRQNA